MNQLHKTENSKPVGIVPDRCASSLPFGPTNENYNAEATKTNEEINVLPVPHADI